MLCFELPYPDADHVSITLVAFGGMPGSSRAIIAVKIDREIAKDTHRQFPEFPADFRRHVEDEQAIYTSLVLAAVVAAEEGVKCVACPGIIVDGRRHLEINVLGEIELCSHLPGQQPGIGIWNLPAAGERARTDRIFRIGVIVDELRKVREDIDLELKRLRGTCAAATLLAVLAVTLRHFCSAAPKSN